MKTCTPLLGDGMRRLRSAEVGLLLGLSATTIQRYAREGRIRYNVTPGGHRRFDIDEVIADLELSENVIVRSHG